MDPSQKILSDIVVFMKYARFLPELGRRETWEELIQRNMEMHLKKYPKLNGEIQHAYRLVFQKKVLPSMRSLQFAGKAIEISPSRIFNCSYFPIDHLDAFSEGMFLLLGGTGVGYSVQSHHIEKLPEIRKPNPKKHRRFLIDDSITGWADAIKVLLSSYFKHKSTIHFDFSDIRHKGARLVTSGGKAPGPQPLKDCLHNIRKILDTKLDGEHLTPLEVHDLMCHIADAVLAGGIRRAAMISFFDADDQEMISCKSGSWWELNPQRGRANNSAVLLRRKVSNQFFLSLWERIESSGSGEPGLYLSHDKDWLSNPCCEIALRPYQCCNLTEVNVSNVESQADLNERVRVGAFIGTLQAGYTDFHYLREIWKRTTEKDALLGVSMTGIASGEVFKYDIREAAKIAVDENVRIAGLIGINPAARVNCVKPAGTSSLVCGSSSGIHAWYAPYYIRRIRVGKNEAIYQYIQKNHPCLVEDEYFRPHDTAVFSFPQKAPDGAIIRTESPIDFLERVKKFHSEWIKPGHISGANSHNVSATVSIAEGQWDDVGNWMWENRNSYNGLSVLPFDGGTYTQAPFEECSKEVYEDLMASLTDVDLTQIIEYDDATTLSAEPACSGGACALV